MAVQYVVTQTCDVCSKEIKQIKRSPEANGGVSVATRGLNITALHQGGEGVAEDEVLYNFDEICDDCLDKVTALLDKLSGVKKRAAKSKRTRAARETAEVSGEPKRKRGRPRKVQAAASSDDVSDDGADAEEPALETKNEESKANGAVVESGEKAAHPF